MSDQQSSSLSDLAKPDSPKGAGPIVAIGFRAESDSVNWGVVTRRDGALLLVAADTVSIPRIYDEAAGLWFLYKRIDQLMDEYAPRIGGVRYPEPSARKARHVLGANARLRVEGVVLALLASRTIPAVTGALTTIGSEMGSRSPKAYLGRSEVRGMDWSGHPTNRREAIIVAIAALEHAEKSESRNGN